jgi:tetratricopeptide (TPR) repeat protein
MSQPSKTVRRTLAAGAGALAAACFLVASPGAEALQSRTSPNAMASQCDRMAGSPYDLQRNFAYPPVAMSNIPGEAVEACRIAFEATQNPRFSYQLGRALNRNAQAAEAMTAYEAAVDSNYAAAMVNVGMLLGRIGDQNAEFSLYTRAADGGNTLAMYNLGVAYRDGLGTTPNGEQAIRWFEKAATAGDDTAAFNIGVIYDEGIIVVEDNETALLWYQMAARGGNADAMVNAGLMLESGEGVKTDLPAAAEMYRQAAIKGDAFAEQKYQAMQQAGIGSVQAPAPAPELSVSNEAVETLVLKSSDVELPKTFVADI